MTRISIKRVLTCIKEYIQSPNYSNNEAPRKERDIQTSKFIHYIQNPSPKGIAKITRDKNPIQVMMIKMIYLTSIYIL